MNVFVVLAFPIFNIVKFANDVCEGSSRNGTCYTSEECSQLGGKDDGTCADGFGVCCKCKWCSSQSFLKWQWLSVKHLAQNSKNRLNQLNLELDLISKLDRSYWVRFKFWLFSVDDIRCGSTVAQNNTFLEPEDSEKTDTGECTYTICPCSTDVCRIR